MKYYYPEHIEGYERIRAEGKAAWNEIHGGVGFENFSSRPFLEEIVPRLDFPAGAPRALELGCGTGPGACWLAERGFQVEAVDLIPTAIEIARRTARMRGLQIHYDVMDVCELPLDGPQYDLIVDSYCLQCIVTREDRAKVFAAVRGRLKPAGYYLVSTAMFDPARFNAGRRIVDPETGNAYREYGDGLMDPETRIVYERFGANPSEYEEAVRIAGNRYLPNRRHWKRNELRREIEAAGFRVLYQDDSYGGNLVCIHGQSENSLRDG